MARAAAVKEGDGMVEVESAGSERAALGVKLGTRPRRLGDITVIAACLISAGAANGQAGADLRPAEQVFKNVQLLKGISANEFMATMGFFTASLGESCTFCHAEESGGNWARYADDNAHKQRARQMIAMAGAINKSYFGGRRALTCYSCHRGTRTPQITPDLEVVYGSPNFPPPDRLLSGDQSESAVDGVLAKYIQAAGGAEHLAALKSFTAKGTYQGYAAPKHPMELDAKAPAQLTMILRGDADGDTVTTYDGREGWIKAPVNDRPQPVTDLTGGDLQGARLDAMLSFPAQIKDTLRQWRVGNPSTIEDRDVQLLQGTIDGRYPVNLYFDADSGLLVRLVRYSDSPVGLGPTQVDYSDYREVAGVKIPFKRKVTWLDGRANIVLNEVQTNAVIDASQFARPAGR
jgi:photosynthetic reaction center cytochrome c subunit